MTIFKLNQKVRVPQQFGYAPMEGIITGFLTNNYNVECAKVKMICNGKETIVPLSSLEYQFKKDKEASENANMQIIVKKVYEDAEIKKIQGTLEEMQSIVGGHIETYPLPGNILCVCNEDGKWQGLTPNIIVDGEIIVGDIFFCSYEGEDFTGLNNEQIGFLMSMLNVF